MAVFDRYVARLVALGRLTDALALYRREIGRNPKDAGLYEKLAAFLDQNRLGGQVEQVYKEAAAKFPDGTWHEKLARWYLRYRRSQDFAELTRQVVRIFSGTELEKYFAQVVNPTALDPALYRQVNLYAHDRFPDNLTFVRNLLAVYARRETADTSEYWRLVRSYWYYDAQLRAQLFQGLSQAGSLDRELAAASNSNPAAARFRAEGEAWRGHFEAAAPLMRATAAEFPGDADVVLRAATLERSLGRTDSAVALARNLSLAAPRDRDALARIGDIYADRERFTRAAPYWNRMPLTEPGNRESWLEAATVFWDYYKYDDALRLIAAARARLKQPALYAYEAGAIYEGKRDYANAVRQYAKGAEPGSQAEARLLHLARNAKYRAVVDSVTAAAPLPLRAAVLEAEQRSTDLAALLKSSAAAETSGATLEFIQSTAARLGLADVEEMALGRQAEVTRDPVERIRLRLAAGAARREPRQDRTGAEHDGTGGAREPGGAGGGARGHGLLLAQPPARPGDRRADGRGGALECGVSQAVPAGGRAEGHRGAAVRAGAATAQRLVGQRPVRRPIPGGDGGHLCAGGRRPRSARFLHGEHRRDEAGADPRRRIAARPDPGAHPARAAGAGGG